MWKPSDVNAAKLYHLLLIQSPSGARSFILREYTETPTDKGLFTFTAPVPIELLLKRNLHAIAKSVALNNGKPFYVDAHGVWLTKDEMSAIVDDKDDDEIPWLNSLPPLLAPK